MVEEDVAAGRGEQREGDREPRPAFGAHGQGADEAAGSGEDLDGVVDPAVEEVLDSGAAKTRSVVRRE